LVGLDSTIEQFSGLPAVFRASA